MLGVGAVDDAGVVGVVVVAGEVGAGVGVVLGGVVVDGADDAVGLAVVPLAPPTLAVVVGLLLEPPQDPRHATISNPVQVLNRLREEAGQKANLSCRDFMAVLQRPTSGPPQVYPRRASANRSLQPGVAIRLTASCISKKSA